MILFVVGIACLAFDVFSITGGVQYLLVSCFVCQPDVLKAEMKVFFVKYINLISVFCAPA